jgi:hypothetical protein
MGFFFVLGLPMYMFPTGGEIWDLCPVMDAKDIVLMKRGVEMFRKEPILKEVGEELLWKDSVLLI